jgi:hypothetical protein
MKRPTTRVCSTPGCPNLTTTSHCPTHTTTHPNGSRTGRDLNTHQRWARRIKARDHHHCQYPGCTATTNLHAHHTNPGNYTLADGITLCHHHHRTIDNHAT